MKKLKNHPVFIVLLLLLITSCRKDQMAPAKAGDTAQNGGVAPTGVYVLNKGILNSSFPVNAIYFFDNLNNLLAFNATTHAVTKFVTDGTSFMQPASIAVSATTGEVFVGDAKDGATNGIVYAFDKTGKLEYTITAGINPSQILLVQN